MEKFRRFLHPVWTGFVLLIAAYVLRGVFLCARDTFLYNRLDLCDPADFKIYHRNTEPKRWRSQVHTYRLYGTLYPEIRNADMRVGYDAYSRYAIGDTIRVYATSSGRVVLSLRLRKCVFGTSAAGDWLRSIFRSCLGLSAAD